MILKLGDRLEVAMAGRQVGFWDVEHRLRELSARGDFAHQKGFMGLMLRTIGIARAEAAITLANMPFFP